MKFDGIITALPNWEFSDDADLEIIIHQRVIEALNNSLSDGGALWLTDDPLGVHFYLNLDDGTAEVSWKRPLADIVLEEVENACLPGGKGAEFPLADDDKAYAARIVRALRAIADQVEALMSAEEQNRPET